LPKKKFLQSAIQDAIVDVIYDASAKSL